MRFTTTTSALLESSRSDLRRRSRNAHLYELAMAMSDRTCSGDALLDAARIEEENRASERYGTPSPS